MQPGWAVIYARVFISRGEIKINDCLKYSLYNWVLHHTQFVQQE